MSIPMDTDGPGVDPCTEVIPPDMVLTIDVNYRVTTLILEKYGNLPLCLENYVLFSLPPIFTNYLIYISIKLYNLSRGIEPSDPIAAVLGWNNTIQ